MSKTNDIELPSSKLNQNNNNNNNNNNSDNDLDWQRDLQILMDMAKMESKIDTDCQLETKRSKQMSEENVLAPRLARPRPKPEESLRRTNFEKGNLLTLTLPLPLKLPNENEHENTSNIHDVTNGLGLLSSNSQKSHFETETRPCAINKTDLDQKLRILTSILSGLSGKLEVLESEEKEHEVQREALSLRLNKLEKQVQNLKLDPFSSRTEKPLQENEKVNHSDSSCRSQSGKKQTTIALEENLLNNVQNIDMIEDEECNKILPKETQSQTFYYVTPVSFLDLMEESD